MWGGERVGYRYRPEKKLRNVHRTSLEGFDLFCREEGADVDFDECEEVVDNAGADEDGGSDVEKIGTTDSSHFERWCWT